MSRRIVWAVIVLSGCGVASEQGERPVAFDVGESNDPIVKAQALAVTTDSVTITLKNTTAYGFSQGLLLFSAPFTVNATASVPMTKFVSSSKNASWVLASSANTGGRGHDQCAGGRPCFSTQLMPGPVGPEFDLPWNRKPLP